MFNQDFEVNERYGSQYVHRLSDKEHPGVSMSGSNGYISDANREFELATTRKPVEVNFVSKDGMQTLSKMTIDPSRFGKDQLAWAAQEGFKASNGSDTLGGRIRKLKVTLEKLKELEMSQPSNGHVQQAEMPAPVGYPMPSNGAAYAPSLPPQYAGPPQQYAGAPQPMTVPPQYNNGAWDANYKQASAAPPPPAFAPRPPGPQFGPQSGPAFVPTGGHAPQPPRIKVEFRSETFGSMTVPYHNVTVQRSAYGEPFALYLTIDNRWEGAMKYMAENFEQAFVYVPGEQVWFQVGATGLVFDLQDPTRDLDQSTAILFIAATQPVR